MYIYEFIDSSSQDCNNSSANALELLLSGIDIYWYIFL